MLVVLGDLGGIPCLPKYSAGIVVLGVVSVVESELVALQALFRVIGFCGVVLVAPGVLHPDIAIHRVLEVGVVVLVELRRVIGLVSCC